MKRVFLVVLMGFACAPRGVEDGGDGNAPFEPPFVEAQSATPYGYEQGWKAQAQRDETCANELVIRARWFLLGRTTTGYITPVIPSETVGLLFDSSTLWLYANPVGAGGFSAVQNETARPWKDFGNYEVDRADGVFGHIETEANGSAIVHMLLHHYEVKALGKTMVATMAHDGWAAKGFFGASDKWASMVNAYPCLAKGPPPEAP